MLVGRESELARLDELLESARGGSSRTLVIMGEPGIGKTVLLEHACSRAEGMRVLAAQGRELESELAFAGLSDLVRPLLGEMARLPPHLRAVLEGSLALGPPVPGDRFTTYVAVLTLLSAAAEKSPLLAIVDDLQWLDAASVEALSFVVRRLASEGIVFLLASRPADHIALLRAGGSELRLGPLDGEAAARLIATHAALNPSPMVVSRLMEQTGGNPLALVELAMRLSADELRGVVPLPDPPPIGPTLRAAFAQRIEELDPTARSALTVAAVSSGAAVADLFGALDSMGIDRAALVAAENAGLLRIEQGELAFRHPLVRAAAYQSAAPSERRAAHQALAAALEGESHRSRRAWHLAAGALGPDRTAAQELERAALEARARRAPAAASEAFHAAARLTPDRDARARLLFEAARELHTIGRFDRVLETLDAAERDADAMLTAQIRVLRGGVQMWLEPTGGVRESLVAQAAAVEPQAPAAAATMLADLSAAALMDADVPAAVASARRAYAAGSRAGGPVALATGVAYALSLVAAGDGARARPLLETCEKALDDEELVAGTYVGAMLGHAYLWLEDLPKADAITTRVVRAMREVGAVPFLPVALGVSSEIQAHRGDWLRARASASQAVELARELGILSHLAFALACLGRIDGAQGREAAGRAQLQEALALAMQFQLGSMLIMAGGAVGALELAAARFGEAKIALDRVARETARGGVREPGLGQWAADHVEACIRAGRPDDGASTLAWLEDRARETGRPWSLAAAARCRGLMSADLESVGHFQRALEWHDRSEQPFERARTLLCYGERLRRCRRPVEARKALREALDIFQGLGASPWSGQASRELAAAGERGLSAPRPARGADLTPQELRVALLASEGLSNREIAAAVLLSTKTVEVHLSRAYHKLGVRSRAALARRLVADGGRGASTA